MKLFGTDGIRGEANFNALTPQNLTRLAMATSQILLRKNSGHAATIVIAKDTRLSGYMVEYALTAGFCGMGVNVVLLGPLPTPALSMLTKSLRADLGLMISASHNPFQDNGIKFFNANGQKFTKLLEEEIEAAYAINTFDLPDPLHLGKARRLDDAAGRYIEYVKNTFSKTLYGKNIILDCANGASYKVAPTILWELGANVVTINATPDGVNINHNSGAMHTKSLQDAVLNSKADIGIALDGDGDRLVLVDNLGRVIDGDKIIGFLASSWLTKKRLTSHKIVSTVMSNFALYEYLSALGLELIQSQVGDKFVYDKMLEHNSNLGGEQSGHIILRDFSSTGDGILAALHVLDSLDDRPAEVINDIFPLYPQITRSIKGSANILQKPTVQEFLKLKEELLQKNHAKLLVRPSGTEPLVRITVQGNDQNLLLETIESIEKVIIKNAA